ncbi:hypothetical protein OIU77_012706 [Salix suchowensis]|uniref:Uncharacterized protein n=1 Tax=Salix suchowensis TaxID=1278906 RepID=A0ABQ9A5C9_9ROSI|nr:hypothetical protein OIU77_012706 [Salix suchowensis]
MIGAEEFKPGRVQETAPLLQDFEDAEETFSFSNLSLNNRDTYWDTSSNQDRSSPADHGVSFEFCSEELARTASSPGSSDSVIFCGKLIPYKGETVEDETEKNLEITAPPEDPKKSSVFPPKLSHSFSKSTESTGKGYPTRRSSDDQKYNSSVRKVSFLMKIGCRSFKLGVEKFPMEMDLSDIRKRQSRRGPTQSMVFPSGDECDQTGKSSRGKREKILWGLLMVNASLGCIPQVSN